jgi:hypothetical protein
MRATMHAVARWVDARVLSKDCAEGTRAGSMRPPARAMLGAWKIETTSFSMRNCIAGAKNRKSRGIL